MKEEIESSPSVKSGWSLKLSVIRLIETPISPKPLSKGRYAVSIAQPRPTPAEKNYCRDTINIGPNIGANETSDVLSI